MKFQQLLVMVVRMKMMMVMMIMLVLVMKQMVQLGVWKWQRSGTALSRQGMGNCILACSIRI